MRLRRALDNDECPSKQAAVMTEPNSIAVETVLRSWLEEPDVTLFCGDWRQGGIMELIPRGTARLTGRHYEPPFDGLRELRIEGAGHHVHLDLARLTVARYRVSPSVCYGFRPSFELRLGGHATRIGDGFGLGLGISSPYAGRSLKTEAVRRYLQRASEHVGSFPGVVDFACEHHRLNCETLPVWSEVAKLLNEFDALSTTALPKLHSAIRAASNLATSLASPW